MSILLKNFNGSEFIPFSQENGETALYLGFLCGVFIFLGILSETLVIASILRVRQKTVDTLFVLSLCVADLIFNIYMFIYIVILLVARGWSIGVIGCKISTAMIIITLATSIASITFITLNRYMAIIWKTNITRFQALVMIAIIWLIFPLIVTLYLTNKELSDSSIALESSYSYCFLDFATTDPIVLTALITIFVFLSLPLFFMFYAYSKIILYYRDMNRKKKKVTSAAHKLEKKLLIKAIAITLAFFITYSVQLFIRLYEFSTKSKVGAVVELVGSVGISLNTLLNSLVLLKFDGTVQSSAIEMLGLKNRFRKRITTPNIQMIQMEPSPKQEELQIIEPTLETTRKIDIPGPISN